MQDDPGHDLHVVVPQPDRPARRLAHGRERLRQDVVGRLALGQAALQLGRDLTQLVVGEPAELLLERVDLVDARPKPADLFLARLGAEQVAEPLEHAATSIGACAAPTSRRRSSGRHAAC
jgi:hypothetical protein